MDKITPPLDDMTLGFSAETDDWWGQFEVMNHLIRFSQLTLLVVAEDELRLNDYLQSYLNCAPSDLQFVMMDRSTITHPTELLDELFSHCDLVDELDKSLSERVDLFHQTLLASGKAPVLIIPDAYTWPIDLMATLFNVLSPDTTVLPSLRCVMMTTPQCISRLAASQLATYLDKHCYLLQLHESSHSEPPIFTGQSKECLMQDQEIDMEASDQNKIQTWLRAVPFHWLLGGGVVLVCVLLVLIQLIFRSMTNNPYQLPERIEEVAVEKVTKPEVQDVATPSPLVVTETTIMRQEASAEVTQEVASAPQATETATQPENPVNAPKKAIEAVQPALVQNLSKTGFNAIHGNHYTLQLMAVTQRKIAADFIAAQHLSPAWVVQTTRQGKTMYIAVYGDYESKSDATAALKTAPVAVQKLKPWARKVAEVQKK